MTRGWVLNVGCYLGWDLQRARSVPTWIISKVESTESTSFPVNSRCVRLNFIVAPLPLSYSIKEPMPGREKKEVWLLRQSSPAGGGRTLNPPFMTLKYCICITQSEPLMKCAVPVYMCNQYDLTPNKNLYWTVHWPCK